MGRNQEYLNSSVGLHDANYPKYYQQLVQGADRPFHRSKADDICFSILTKPEYFKLLIDEEVPQQEHTNIALRKARQETLPDPTHQRPGERGNENDGCNGEIRWY